MKLSVSIPDWIYKRVSNYKPKEASTSSFMSELLVLGLEEKKKERLTETIRTAQNFQYSKRRPLLFPDPIHILALKLVRRANSKAKLEALGRC